MWITTYLEWLHEGEWHRVGWAADTPDRKRDLRAHGQKLSEGGDRYRLVQDCIFAGHPPVVVHEYPVVANYYVEKNERRLRVAAALYHHFRINEAKSQHIPDVEVYAGWFPWENLGSQQEAWLESADVAIRAMDS